MVTGRIDEEKKARGARVLAASGLNASQAINLMYDRLIEENSVDFLSVTPAQSNPERWQQAQAFVQSLVVPATSRFDEMSKAEIKMDRLRSRGLV